MKKILMISGSLPPIRCGVGYYTAQLTEEMSKEGVNFELLSTKGVNKEQPVTLKTVNNWRISSLPRMLSAIRKSKATIVHIQYPAIGYRRQLGINLLPYVLRILKPKIKIVITLHEYHQSRRIGRVRNRVTIFPAHKVLVSNRPDVKALKAGDKVILVPIGANFDVAPRRPAFFKKILAAQSLNPKKPTLVFFGYAFPSKRLEVLLEAMQLPTLLDHQLLLLGSIDERSDYQVALKTQVEEINRTKNRIGMTGFLEGEDVSAIMQECRYFIIPNSRPLSAKSGTAIAAAQNRMIVVSRGSEQPDDTQPFEHLKNCYLLDRVNPKSISDAIQRLEANPEEVSKILAGTTELKSYFSWEHIVKEHLRIYSEV